MLGDRAQSHNPAICETRGHEYAPLRGRAALCRRCRGLLCAALGAARAERRRPSIARSAVSGVRLRAIWPLSPLSLEKSKLSYIHTAVIQPHNLATVHPSTGAVCLLGRAVCLPACVYRCKRVPAAPRLRAVLGPCAPRQVPFTSCYQLTV